MKFGIPTAQESKQQIIDITAIEQRRHLSNMKDDVSVAIRNATNAGLTQVTVQVSCDIEPMLVNAFKGVLKNLGYKVRLANETGFYRSPDARDGALLQGVYVAPKVTMTISW